MEYALSLAMSYAVDRLLTFDKPCGLANEVLTVLALNLAMVFILFKWTMTLLLYFWR